MAPEKTIKYGKPLYVLNPGDFIALNEDCLIQTVTGNSLVVCLYDDKKKIGGMAHFIVPGTIEEDKIFADRTASDGIYNMELLMAEIVKMGGDRRRLKAKLFGAGYIDCNNSDMKDIEDSNIRFVHEYFSLENIEVEKKDLGGDYRRMIFFSPVEGTAYRRFQRRLGDSPAFADKEKEYISDAIKNKNKSGDVILF